MTGDASYGSLSTYLEDAKRHATFADLTCNGWDLIDDTSVRKVENYGESSSTWVINFDGSTSGSSYNIGTSSDDPSLAAQAKQEYDNYYKKWDERLDDLVRGWDDLPEDDALKSLIETMGSATKKVAGGTGNAGTKFGNPDLSVIGTIRQTLSGQKGNTILYFNTAYGPDRVEQVLDGHCEVMAALGAALAGQQEVWKRGRVDVAAIMQPAAKHFKETRKNSSTNWEGVLSIASASLDVVALFGSAVPGIGTAISGAKAGSGFLSAALGLLKNPTDADAKGEYSGKSPDDVYEGLKTTFGKLDTNMASQEEGIESMLKSMLTAISTDDNQGNFHIHPKAGIDPDFAGTDDIVDMSFPAIEGIGYNLMPQIANAFFQSADIARDAYSRSSWYRPYATVPGSSIGMNAYGPYDAWEDLLYGVVPLMNDTGSEIVHAGELLAKAAGYLRSSDDWAKKKLGENYEDVQNGTDGWRKPEPAPPSTYGEGGPGI